MNYEAFMLSLTSPALFPICEMKYVEYNGHILASHVFTNCYGRQALASKNDMHFENNISIFFGPMASVMIFRCFDLFSCELVEWYGETQVLDESSFLEIPGVLEKLITIQRPRIAETEELSALFESQENILRYLLTLYFCFGWYHIDL